MLLICYPDKRTKIFLNHKRYNFVSWGYFRHIHITCVLCSCTCIQAEDAAPHLTLNTVHHSYLTYTILSLYVFTSDHQIDVHSVLRSLSYSIKNQLQSIFIKMCYADGQQKEHIQDLVIQASYTGCSIGFLASIK